MGFFKKLFGKKEESPATTNQSTEASATTPAFKKMMTETENDQLTDIYDNILPSLKAGMAGGPMKIMIEGKEVEMPAQSTPVSFPAFDNLSVLLTIDRGTHVEWLQQKQIASRPDITGEQLLNKAYENLFNYVRPKMAFNVLRENLGLFSQCDGFESSLVMLPVIWDKIYSTFNTDEAVFGIPTPDVFVVCNKYSEENVNFIIGKVKEIYSNPQYNKKISDRIYSRNKSGEIKIISS